MYITQPPAKKVAVFFGSDIDTVHKFVSSWDGDGSSSTHEVELRSPPRIIEAENGVKCVDLIDVLQGLKKAGKASWLI
jgi:hypothetical protein